MLTVKNLNKKFHDKWILKNVSFDVSRGQIAIFLGGSGVGKSTLLRVLNHLESYDSGKFTLDGHHLDLAQVSHDHTIGMVFQHFNLFEHLNVLENMTLALTKVQKINREEAIEIAATFLKRYGLHDKMFSSVHKLSGGQKQRLSLARTLVLNPQVICMDEPTSALDPFLTNQIAAYVSELAQDGRVILIATHDMNLVKKLKGSLFLMKEGTIIQTVSTADYEANPTLYSHIQDFVES